MKSFTNKKLLLIFELNQTLLYLHNKNSKIVKHGIPTDITYHDKRGRIQLLEYLFQMQSKTIDVAVWSQLDNTLTQSLSQKFFGRYFRSLLFVLGTNRQLYGNHSPQQSIKIRKDLKNVYKNFPGYQPGNTLVISSMQNLLEDYKKNDLIVPRYTPQSPTFNYDGGSIALCKYIKGLVILQSENKIQDIRSISNTKQVDKMFERCANTAFTGWKNI